MSERQTSVKAEKKGAKRCSLCEARLWLKDYTTGTWSGPWHFADCPEVPGGEDLSAANIEHQMRWELEKPVPKEQGRRILEAIKLMLSTPKTPEGKPSPIFYQRKAAILEEIGKLSVMESQGNE